MTRKPSPGWTFAITSVALFMVALDNLVVTTALPVHPRDLDAVARGARVDRQRLHADVRRAAAHRRGARRPLRPPPDVRLGLAHLHRSPRRPRRSPRRSTRSIAARAIQGLGGAIVMPLTLTILSAARCRPSERGLALGAWGGIGGLAVALGPVVGGAVVEGISWQWIFWINVPIGLVLAPARACAACPRAAARRRALDLPGLASSAPACSASCGAWSAATSRAGRAPRSSARSSSASRCSWRLRRSGSARADADAAAALLPQPRRSRAANVASLLMFFGMFGSIFLLAQFLQTVQGYSPLQAGLRTLPWTAMPIFVAPIAGALSDRIGGAPADGVGLALQAIGARAGSRFIVADVAVQRAGPPFVIAGIGMALFFAPIANVVPRRRAPEEEGQASGANNAIRELGGVFGVAVLASVFAAAARTPQPAGLHRRHGPGGLGRRRLVGDRAR